MRRHVRPGGGEGRFAEEDATTSGETAATGATGAAEWREEFVVEAGAPVFAAEEEHGDTDD